MLFILIVATVTIKDPKKSHINKKENKTSGNDNHLYNDEKHTGNNFSDSSHEY